MPHGTGKAELTYYRTQRFFGAQRSVEALDIHEILRRKVAGMFERHGYYPADLFFFNYLGIQFFGRKTMSQLHLDGTQSFKKCNQIAAFMIVGLVSRVQVIDKGVTVFYRPLTNGEKVFLFNYLKQNPQADLHYPFPVLTNGLQESVQPPEAWDPSEELPHTLNEGEAHIRAHTLAFMSQFDLKDKVVYDPACSTGKFLGSIKERFPEIRAIGQDRNPDMVKHAKKNSRIDVVYLGDSLYPCIGKESVDFLFFRFLNLAVMSAKEALNYFSKLSQCCKVGGTMVVFGFTPVLLGAELFELLGLKVEQTTAYSKENDTIFQYYVLTKLQPTKALRFEDLSPYHRPPTTEYQPAGAAAPPVPQSRSKL